MRIFVLFLTTTMSIVSLLGGLSAVNILTNPGNVAIDTSSIDFQFNFTRPEDTNLTVPFHINNAGYFSLNGLNIDIKINMIYNTTLEEAFIFDKAESYPDLPAGQVLNENYTALEGDGFIIPNFPDPYQVDFGNPIILISNITITARYSLDLLSFRVRLVNVEIATL